ncbi:MAG TPA: EF-hand domain-containing protein [Methylomirabilota bacterium]|nr:EF-hand domain-containing protein [Methylomirabilota bacterium]
MMRTPFRYVAAVSVLGLLLLGGPAMAQTRPAPDTKTWVKDHDRNGDGKIDREEFHQAAVEAFFFRDKNKSGYLTIEELKEVSPEALKAVKRKVDGQISLHEYINALFKDFDAADIDKDGLLTVEEIDIYMSRAK